MSAERPTVYVVQVPVYMDHRVGEWVPKYDLSPASAHGEVVVLLPRGNLSLDSRAISLLVERLSGYTLHDCILALGDPVSIAAAAMIASRVTGGPVRILRWDRLSQAYVPCLVDPRA